MKRIYKYIGISLGILFLCSCSNFLKVERYGDSNETGFKTKEDVNKAMYALLSNVSNNSEGVTGRGIMWFECCTDDIEVGRPNSQAEEIRDFNMSPSNGRDVSDTWKAMYEINTKANNLINVVPSLDFVDDNYKNQVIGTAYFFRGLAMLWIAPYYGDNGANGGIPIVLENSDLSKIDSPRPKSVLENYKQIISDFKKAGELLPYLSSIPKDRYGLPHKGAAWGFAARAALYASAYDKSYFDTVLEMTKKVMDMTGSDKRALVDDGTDKAFAELWTPANNFTSEYLFSLLGNATDGTKFHGVTFQKDGWGLYNTWGYYVPTYNLYEAFEDGDIRRDATILYPGQTVRFMSQDIVYGDAGHEISSTTGMAFIKFLSPWRESSAIGVTVSSNGDNGSNNLGQSLLRYADVLLMRAEALIQTKGEGDSEAKEILNSIRKRARLAENSQGTMAELKQERRVELAFEFMPSRFVDLVRWGDIKEAVSKPTKKLIPTWDKTTNTMSTEVVNMNNGRNYDPNKNNVFPIPANAFDGTKNLKQNIGY